MAMPEDLTAFLNPAEFADAGTLGGVTVYGIFDTSTDIVSGDVATQAPTVLLATSVTASVAIGAAYIRNGVTYSVRAIDAEPPDGAFTRLVLARA